MAEQRVALVLGRWPDLAAACAAALAGGGARTHVLLTDEIESAEGLERGIRLAREEAGQIDTLVTVPSAPTGLGVLGADRAALLSAVDHDLASAFEAARMTAPEMVDRGWGRIVFVGSVAGLYGDPAGGPHAVAMAGLVGLARSLTREVGEHQVTVNVVAPGLIGAVGDDPADLKRLLDKTPLRRVGDIDDVAAAVAFLASEDASFMTGTVLPVDGGLAMGFS